MSRCRERVRKRRVETERTKLRDRKKDWEKGEVK